MKLEQAIVDEIVGRIVAVADPDRIILFGSAAAGTMTPDSDVDVLILKSSLENGREQRIKIRRELGGLGHSFDLLMMRTDRFEESKNVVGGIAYPAHKYGAVIYEAA